MNSPDNLVAKILDAIPDKKQKNWIKEKLKYANELSLRKRMKQMIEPFKDFFMEMQKSAILLFKKLLIREIISPITISRLENKALSGKKLGDLEKLDRLHLKLKALLQLHFLKLMRNGHSNY